MSQGIDIALRRLRQDLSPYLDEAAVRDRSEKGDGANIDTCKGLTSGRSGPAARAALQPGRQAAKRGPGLKPKDSQSTPARGGP